MRGMRAPYIVLLLAAAQLASGPAYAASTEQQAEKPAALSPEETMQRRFPQPARVGDLIGLAVLDDYDQTIGRVRHVVRTPEGKIRLIVTHGGLFGFGTRLVAVPIEVVALLGQQFAALEITPADFAKAPTWAPSQETTLRADEIVRVGLTKR